MKKNKVFIIAEAGVNHNGDIKVAERLVDAAQQAGADAVKFQMFKAERLASVKAPKAAYQRRTTSKNESQWKMLKKLELSEQDHTTLMKHCKRRKIMFLSSPFDEQSADVLEALNVPLFKIPSGEITNHPYLKHIAKKKKPIILSTGMSTLDEIQEALSVIKKAGAKDITVMHCVTEYPAPVNQINLRAISTLKENLKCRMGYSDHTEGIEIAGAAVALGATVIEKHLTLNKKLKGPDHKASLEPEEFNRMVESIRNIEQAMGDGVKKPAPCELKNMRIARKSMVARNDIIKGKTLDVTDMIAKRPGHGISPRDINRLIGKKVRTTLKKDHLIRWQDLV